MKELEKLLYNTPKPEVKVTSFRRNLRRSLLNSGRYAKDNLKARGILFFAPTVLACFLAVVLVLFVINPKIPFNFNKSISTGRASLEVEQAGEVGQKETESVNFNGNLAKWVEQLHQSTEEDLDKAFVRYLSRERHQFDPVDILPVGETRLLAVTQYQMNNGQRVVVYTQLPDEQIRYFRAY